MPDLPDPSTLTDEELDKILAGEEPEEPEEPQEQDEEPKKPEDKPEEQEDEHKDEGDEHQEDDEKKTDAETPKKPEGEPSRREQLRVQHLLEKYGKPGESKQIVNPSGIDYEKELDADPELLKKLNDDRQRAAEESFNQGLAAANFLQFRTMLEIDASRVSSKYPQLDKDSDDFDKNVADGINTLYLQIVGFDPKSKSVANPDLRYGEFVPVIYQLAEDIASNKNSEVTNEIKKQAAKTGIRPAGATPKLNFNKAPHDMSDEELDGYLKSQGLL